MPSISNTTDHVRHWRPHNTSTICTPSQVLPLSRMNLKATVRGNRMAEAEDVCCSQVPVCDTKIA